MPDYHPPSDRCPTCHVITPAQCRNTTGQKVWPPHTTRPTTTPETTPTRLR